MESEWWNGKHQKDWGWAWWIGNGYGGLGMDMVDWECRKYNLGHGESEQVVRFVRFHDEMVPRVCNDCILSATLVGRVLL